MRGNSHVRCGVGEKMAITSKSYLSLFGDGFIGYALERGGYSKEVATQFSYRMAAREGWSRYGDVPYVDHVMQYYNGGNGSVVVMGDGSQFLM